MKVLSIIAMLALSSCAAKFEIGDKVSARGCEGVIAESIRWSEAKFYRITLLVCDGYELPDKVVSEDIIEGLL